MAEYNVSANSNRKWVLLTRHGTYIGPVHHDVILGMPWVAQWKARMRPLQAAIEVCAPGAEERVRISVLPTTLTSSNVSGVEPVPQRNEAITAPTGCRGQQFVWRLISRMRSYRFQSTQMTGVKRHFTLARASLSSRACQLDS